MADKKMEVKKAANRDSREEETREAESREVAQEWRPPSLLPDPHPREGIAHRWIAVAAGGVENPANFSRKKREGWEPCDIEEYPEMRSIFEPESRYGKKGNIEVGGLLLCRMPQEMVDQRTKHYLGLATGQVRAVEAQLLGNEDRRAPMSSSVSSKTEFGRSRTE